FPNYINILEEPHLKKGIGSLAFDDEGVATKYKAIVKSGVLNSYILDSYSSRVLKSTTTGNAGGISNIIIKPTVSNFNELLQQMNEGLVIVEIMGKGINIMTGEFSFGAFGFYVSNGTIQFPIEEITIAGNMKDYFKKIIAISDDSENKTNIQSGSILV